MPIADRTRNTATGAPSSERLHAAVTMVIEPDHSNELLETAERKWNTANREDHPVDKCEYLQLSMERAFKALITAKGRRVQHTHELDDLWTQAEADGEQIRAIRNPEQLGKLSKYAGNWRYALPANEDPAKTWAQNRLTGEDLLNHARTRVPQLLQETRNHLSVRKTRLAPEGKTVNPPRLPRDPQT